MEQPLQTRNAHGGKQDQHSRQNYPDDEGRDIGNEEQWESGGNPHQVSEWESTGHGSGGAAAGNGLQLGIGDMFDVALTAIAFLAFGIFILNVFLGILLPVSALYILKIIFANKPTHTKCLLAFLLMFVVTIQ